MNPAQFQNMGQLGGGMPTTAQPQMRPGSNLTSQQISRIIMQNLTGHTQSLQAQGKFMGWHSTFPIEQRAVQVKLLIDSLRLIQPIVAYDQAVNVALTFEQKAFSQEPSREKYLETIKEKLGRIQDTRATQVQSQSSNLQQVMQSGQNMNFNPQLQQQMQPSFMMPQNMPHSQQNLNQGMLGQSALGRQNVQQRGQVPNRSNFNDDDNKNINQLAANLAKQTSSEDMRRIREMLTDQQKQQMAMKNVDPLAFYFRAQATKEYSRRKLAAQAQMPQDGNLQMQQQMQQNFGMQTSGSSFPGSLDRYQGQQADGMRSQEIGELVVPASNTQGVDPEQFQLQKEMLQNQQRQASGTPNPILTQQQNQQSRQAQAQAQSRAQAAARLAQLGISGPSNLQNPPQANPTSSQVRGAIPNTQGINRPPSRAPQQSQLGMPGQPGAQHQQPGQGAQNPLARFPPELQAILRQKPQSEWKAVAQAYMAQQNRLGMDRSLSQQPNSMSVQNLGQIQQLPNGQYLGGSTIGPSPMKQSLSTGAMPTQAQAPKSQLENAQQFVQQQQQQQQRQIQQSQELARQRQIQMSHLHQQQMQNQQQQAQLQQQLQAGQPQVKPAGPALTATQLAYMDHQEAHSSIVQNLQQHQQWSPAIKTWGQLKQWLQRYPIATLPISRIEEIQKIQFGSIMALRQRMHQQSQQQGGGQQQQIMQQSRPGMPQHTNPGLPNNVMTQVKPVTAEEIANARRINPQFQSMPDARIGAFMYEQRVRAVQNRLNGQAPPQEPVFMPVQIGQAPSQHTGAPMARQPSGPGAQPVPAQQGTQGAQRPPLARPSQGQPQGGSQGPPKTLKRPGDVESIQASQVVQPGSRSQEQQASGGVPNLSREQFEKLPIAQQQRFMAMKRMEQRNKEAGIAIIQLTKELQSTMPSRKAIANMNAMNKSRATKLLTQDQTKNMLGRFDQFIVQFLTLSNDRETTKQLITLRLQLMPQYKPQSLVNKTYEVVDQYSMTADQIEAALTEMFQKFQMTLQKSTQMRQQSQAALSQGPRAPQQLTPGNLELLEQQEAQRRDTKASKGKDIPPAPTSSQPPFTFGDARGQGTPKYASVGLKQEDLKLDPKRRKRNPPAGVTSATPNTAAAGLKANPTIKEEQQNTRMESEMPFKCSISNCEHETKGFTTQVELDMHKMTAHRPTEEPVEDPITFFIENMHSGLGLDKDGQSIPERPEVGKPRSLPMQKTASTASARIKAETISKPATPLGHHLSSNSANPAATVDDSWSKANVKPELLQEVFSGPDPFAANFDLDEFVRLYKQSNSWKALPRADPQDGFCADWKEPEELREAGERKRESKPAEVAGVDVKSPAAGVDLDLMVNLKIDGIDSNSDLDWDEVENLNVGIDHEMDLGSPWENVPSPEAPASPIEQGLTADELIKIPWDELLDNGAGPKTRHDDDDTSSRASYESLDWDAMFADQDNIVPGTNGMQAKRKIIKVKAEKAL